MSKIGMLKGPGQFDIHVYEFPRKGELQLAMC